METDVRTHQPSTGPWTTLRLVVGFVCLALGIAVLAVPDASLLVVAVLFGLQLVVAGIVRTVLAAGGPSGWARTIAILLGAITVVAGIVCVARPGTSLLVLVLSVALGWASDGLADLVAGITVRQPPARRVLQIAVGIASIVAAVLIVTFPGTSLRLFTLLGGVLLLVLGALTLAGAGAAHRRRDRVAP